MPQGYEWRNCVSINYEELTFGALSKRAPKKDTDNNAPHGEVTFCHGSALGGLVTIEIFRIQKLPVEWQLLLSPLDS